MPAKEDFQIDYRVTIGLDALSGPEKADIEPLLESKEAFLEHAKGVGCSRKLPNAKSIYEMSAGDGERQRGRPRSPRQTTLIVAG